MCVRVIFLSKICTRRGAPDGAFLLLQEEVWDSSQSTGLFGAALVMVGQIPSTPYILPICKDLQISLEWFRYSFAMVYL